MMTCPLSTCLSAYSLISGACPDACPHDSMMTCPHACQHNLWFLMHVQVTHVHISFMMRCPWIHDDISTCLSAYSLISNACPDVTCPHNFYEDMSKNPWWNVHCLHAYQHILWYLMHVQMNVHIIPWWHVHMLVKIISDFWCMSRWHMST